MPLTATGFQRRTRAEIVEALEESLRSRISDKLDLTERTVLGNLVQICAEHFDQFEALLEEAYASFDVDSASDDRLVALSLLTGTPRRGATKGLVDVTLTTGGTFAGAAPGELVATVTNEASNRWVNRDDVPAGTGPHSAVFEAETAGAAGIAPAGTLTVIADGGATGWTAITNADDATPGTDIESIEDLRLRRELSVAAGGSRTRNAIRAKLVAVDGVLSAEVFENVTSSTDGNGIPPHAIRAVVWDGSPAAADDNDIAQAIWDHKAEGILSDGGESGIAQDEVLGPVTVAFERAVEETPAVVVDIASETGVAIEDIEQAIIDAWPTRVGEPVIYNRIAAALFRVAGVDDWNTLTIDGGTADLPGAVSSIYTISPGAITVTGDAS